MKKNAHDSRHPSAPGLVSIWILWPVLTLLFGSIPFVVVLVLSTGARPLIADYWAAISSIGKWLAPAFANGFSALQTVGMLLVAAAAFTGLAGDWQSVPLRARRLIRPLSTVCLVTIAAIGVFAGPVIIHAPESASSMILLWMCSWAVMLFALGVSEIAPLRRQMILARARHVRALRLTDTDALTGTPKTSSFVIALVTVFGISIATTYATSGIVALVIGHLWPLNPVMLLLAYATFVGHVGWTMRADRTQSTALRRVGTFIILLGGVIGVFFGAALMAVPPAGIAFIALSVSWTFVLLRPGTLTRLWPYRVISATITSRALTALDEQTIRIRKAWEREHRLSVAAVPRRGLREMILSWLASR